MAIDASPTPLLNRRWAQHTLAAATLALFVAILYATLLFTNRVLANGDILLYFYGYRDYASEALRSGRIPLWNPYIFMGAPFLANPQAAVLYPPHWPLLWLSVTKQVYWSAALHTWLLGFGGYLFMRRTGNGLLAGLVTGLILAGSGFYGGMIGHLNQMNGAAWLPWLLIAVTPPWGRVRHWARLLLATLLGAAIVALMLLAGHTQTAYINLFGAGMWTLALAARGLRLRRTQPALPRESWYAPLVIFGASGLVGALLAAPQLLPTLELSQLGIRSGGLPWLEATSFSLKPLSLPWTLLPTYGLRSYEAIFETAAWSEFIAWIGVIGLLLAAYGAWRGRGLARWLGIGFVVLGMGLALGRWNPAYWALHAWVPGFDLFRTPARWMMLYTMGAAALAGLGAQAFLRWTHSVFLPSPSGEGPGVRWRHYLGAAVIYGLPVLIAIELLLAARALPLANPTAPEAVYGLRTAPAHLVTDPARLSVDPATLDPGGAGRFLGMSTITYDPGDMPETQRIYGGQLDAAALHDLIIAQKVQELLVPNLSLLWRVPAVDGYDGGTLPLQRYNQLVTLLSPEVALAPDGRLREQILDVPPAVLLDLLDVQYIIADKVRDLWFDDVYYDRQIGMELASDSPTGTITVPQPFEATHLDLIATVAGDANALAALHDQEIPLADLTLHGAGQPETLTVTAGGAPGAMLADGTLDSPMAATSGATVAYRDVEGGAQEYRVRLPLIAPSTAATITVALRPEAVDAGLGIDLQAATLYDERTAMFSALLPSDRGDFALVHSGDVKVYENLGDRGRAWLAYATESAETPAAEAAALRAIVDSGVSATRAVVGSGAPTLVADPTADRTQDSVEILSWQPERVVLSASNASPALLVLADANYPGWYATVDGVTTPIYTANVLFRGVPLDAGEHEIIFEFKPQSWRTGLLIGIVVLLAWCALVAIGFYYNARQSPPSRPT